MMTEPIDLFYSYAHEDAPLRHQLNQHLASLQRQGVICAWYDREILAGDLWAQEINSHLQGYYATTGFYLTAMFVIPSTIASSLRNGLLAHSKFSQSGEAVADPLL